MEHTFAQIELSGLAKTFPGGIPALQPLDLSIEAGELIVVLGPSGSGKSTLLRLIAGLETPTAGRVVIDGVDMTGVPPHRRDVAMVFQHPALYPHLSVADNVAFGLRARGMKRAQARTKVNMIAGILGLDPLLGRRPGALSGGERQRVAIGRAMVRQPRVLLLDEPFSSLDLPLRAALRAQVVALKRQLGTTLIHVTHDQAEALSIGDRVVVLDRGQILQTEAPRAIYEQPASRFVATFVGSPPMNIVPCQVALEGDLVRIHPVATDRGSSWVAPHSRAPAGWPAAAGLFDLGLRPEAISLKHLHADDGRPDVSSVSAQVRGIEFNGADVLATLAVGPHSLVARWPSDVSIDLGRQVEITLDMKHAVWFDQSTGRALAAG